MDVGVAVAITVLVDPTPRVVADVDIPHAGRPQLGVFFQDFHERAVVVVFGQIHAQNSFRLAVKIGAVFPWLSRVISVWE